MMKAPSAGIGRDASDQPNVNGRYFYQKNIITSITSKIIGLPHFFCIFFIRSFAGFLLPGQQKDLPP
jgi:hypothetical protein